MCTEDQSYEILLVWSRFDLYGPKSVPSASFLHQLKSDFLHNRCLHCLNLAEEIREHEIQYLYLYCA